MTASVDCLGQTLARAASVLFYLMQQSLNCPCSFLGDQLLGACTSFQSAIGQKTANRDKRGGRCESSGAHKQTHTHTHTFHSQVNAQELRGCTHKHTSYTPPWSLKEAKRRKRLKHGGWINTGTQWRGTTIGDFIFSSLLGIFIICKCHQPNLSHVYYTSMNSDRVKIKIKGKNNQIW